MEASVRSPIAATSSQRKLSVDHCQQPIVLPSIVTTFLFPSLHIRLSPGPHYILTDPNSEPVKLLRIFPLARFFANFPQLPSLQLEVRPHFHRPGNYAEKRNIGSEIGLPGKNGPVVTAVVLGSKPEHLKRFVEFYNSKGLHAVTFVASPSDVLSIDLGRKLQERIRGLASELVYWLSESEMDGGDRFLVFHTFSTSRWLV